VEAKRLLHGAVDAALSAAHGRTRVAAFLSRQAITTPVWLIAVGKAAGAMSQGAVDVLGDRIESGLVISKRGFDEQSCPALPHFTPMGAGHPIPDESSLRAGRLLVEMLDEAPREATLLFLVSGGASSLVEVLPDGVELADLQRVNQWLLGAGWNIAAVNGLRRRLSCIKGGRLARWVDGRRVFNLLISDVPGDDPALIGSGLLAPGRDGAPAPTPVPQWTEKLLQGLDEAPYPAAEEFKSISTHIVASPALARRAAADYVAARGYTAHCHDRLLCGDFLEVAGQITATLLTGPKGVHVWSGEPTVRLPRVPGRGGRNQSLALAVARGISGDVPKAFVSVGTDGNDGMTEDAGALADNNTIREGKRLGLNADDVLQRADAGSYLEDIGALVHTGPTGTNVMDLMLGIC
jgi:glycerate 2-kinase